MAADWRCWRASALAVRASGRPRAEGRCGSYAWCNTSLSPSERARTAARGDVAVGQGRHAHRPGSQPTWACRRSSSPTAPSAPAAPARAWKTPPRCRPGSRSPRTSTRRWRGATAKSSGDEVRHRGFDGDYGPTVNIMRTPLGGRTYEGYGEDPYLDAQTAVGWIDGFQSQGVMADPKHFAANNQEGQIGVSPAEGVIGGRFDTDVDVDPRWLHEIEFPAFEAAVQQAHAATVMCSYNLVNGAYSCANPYLLKHTLREEWGFQGFVQSDAGACHEPNDDIEAGLNLDILDTCYSAPEVDALLAAGVISEADAQRTRLRNPAHAVRVRLLRPPDLAKGHHPGQRRRRRGRSPTKPRRAARCCCENDGALPINPTQGPLDRRHRARRRPVHPRQRLLGGDALLQDDRAARASKPAPRRRTSRSPTTTARRRRAPKKPPRARASRSSSSPTPSPRASTSRACR